VIRVTKFASTLSYAGEEVEQLAVIHALNREIVLRGFREKFHRAFGIRNVEELFDIVPGRMPLESFIERARSIIPNFERALEEVSKLLRSNVGVIPFYSPHYPRELRSYRTGSPSIYPPLVLYVKPPVSLGALDYIAVVGTRRCSGWGREVAYRVGSLIAEKGYTLVTGLAECIDEYATKGALEAGGITVGVRPWLEPLTLPRGTRVLIDRYGGGVAVTAEHFSKPIVSKMLYYLRNRVIAGMAKLVVVVEAREGGGSMHQIEWALKHGKPLAIFEHPERGSQYYWAFLKYMDVSKLSRGGSQFYVIRSLEELAEILSSKLAG